MEISAQVGRTSSQIAMLGSGFPFYSRWTSLVDNWRGRQSLFAPDPPLYLTCLQYQQNTRFWTSYDCPCFIGGITEAQE